MKTVIPKKMSDAIENAIIDQQENDMFVAIEEHVTEFIQQKVAVLMIEANPEQKKILMKLQAMLYKEEL